MVEMLEAVASWQSLLMVLLVFGVAPGLVLRLIVRIYPKDDPRRRELVAELYVQNRFERPLWVAEQLETALTEGASQRLKDIRDRRRARKGSKNRIIERTVKNVNEDDRIEHVDSVTIREYRRSDGLIVEPHTIRRRRPKPKKSKKAKKP